MNVVSDMLMSLSAFQWINKLMVKVEILVKKLREIPSSKIC